MKLPKTIHAVRETGAGRHPLAVRTKQVSHTMTAESARLPLFYDGKEVRIPFVFLELTESPARSVAIVGTFNEWHPGATQMINLGDGCWVKELCLLPGNHEYRLIVDGEWIPDPWADEYVLNPFGGINSVITIPPAIASAETRARSMP